MEITNEDNEAYAPKLVLIRHTGAVIVWSQRSFVYRGQPDRLRPQVVSVTVKNLLFGWWSIVSIFANPVVTIGNWARFSRYTKEYQRYIAAPEQYLREAKQAAEVSAVRQAHTRKRLFIFLGVAVPVLAVVVIAGFILDQ